MAKTALTAVVTDTYACYGGFPGSMAGQITLAPNRITIAGKSYREELDLSPEEAHRLIAGQEYAPLLVPPSPAEYAQIYGRVAERADAIISIHASRDISQSWANAKAGATQVSHCPIAVIDSRTLSVGQAMLVRLALDAVDSGMALEDIARLLRAAVDRIYSAFYVETLGFLFQNRVIEPAHVIIGAMVGVKPLLTIESGRLVPMEKVKNRSQAVERLVEFAIEFSDVSEAIILQPRSHLMESGRMLQDRLALEFPERPFAHAAYGASLSVLIGTEATGLVVLEREMDTENGF